jgi:hypothetical protein
MGNVVEAIMGYYTIWLEMPNIDPDMMETMKHIVTYLENAIMANESGVDMEGVATEDIDMESPMDTGKIEQVVKEQLTDLMKDNDSIREELIKLVNDANENVKDVMREECKVILREMERMVKAEGTSADKQATYVSRTLKKIHDNLIPDHMSADGTEKTSGDEDENAQRKRHRDRDLSDNQGHAAGLSLENAMKNNMTDLVEGLIDTWLGLHREHMENATKEFDHDLMKFKNIILGKKELELSTKIWDIMIGSTTAKRNNYENNRREPIMNVRMYGRYLWLPWYTVKEFVDKKDVWGPISDETFWQVIMETKNHTAGYHSFMVKQMSGTDAIMIKVTPHHGDYSTVAHRDKQWPRKKGKGGGWMAPSEDKGEKDSQRAQGSGNWHHWDPPVATANASGQAAKENQGDQQAQDMQQPTEPAPWQKGKGKQQMPNMVVQEQKGAPWHKGKGNQDIQFLNQNQQTMMTSQKGAPGAHQQGMAGQQGTPAAQAAWHQGHYPMHIQQSAVGQQKGMKGQSNMGQPGMSWGQQTASIQANANMGNPSGAPPGPNLPFDINQGPLTWLIGQWHPTLDANWEVTSWYLVEKHETCDWLAPDGSQQIAEHIHGDSLENTHWLEQYMNTGQGGNESALPIWNTNTKGKGKG